MQLKKRTHRIAGSKNLMHVRYIIQSPHNPNVYACTQLRSSRSWKFGYDYIAQDVGLRGRAHFHIRDIATAVKLAHAHALDPTLDLRAYARQQGFWTDTDQQRVTYHASRKSQTYAPGSLLSTVPLPVPAAGDIHLEKSPHGWYVWHIYSTGRWVTMGGWDTHAVTRFVEAIRMEHPDFVLGEHLYVRRGDGVVDVGFHLSATITVTAA